jgi:hypothetical protein
MIFFVMLIVIILILFLIELIFIGLTPEYKVLIKSPKTRKELRRYIKRDIFYYKKKDIWVLIPTSFNKTFKKVE